MLLEDRAIEDGHLPPGKIDKLGAVADMKIIKRRPLEHRTEGTGGVESRQDAMAVSALLWCRFHPALPGPYFTTSTRGGTGWGGGAMPGAWTGATGSGADRVAKRIGAII